MSRTFENVLRRLPEEAVALCFVLYLLAGRWSYARLDPGISGYQPLYEPRFLLIPAMYGVLMFVWRRERPQQNKDQKAIHQVALCLVFFLSYMMTTALWSHDAEFAAMKFIELLMVMLAMLAFVWALSLCEAARIRDAVFRYSFVICGTLALLGLRSITESRLAVLGGGPNVYGRNMCLLAACCLYFWRKQGRPWLWLPGVGMSLLLVILTGSRGALVAFSVLTLGFLVMSRRRLITTLISLGTLGLITYVVLVDSSIWEAVERTFNTRVIELTLRQRRDAGRSELFEGAINLAMQSPVIGKGLASGRAFLGQYPHNLFLESLTDGGFLGLGLLGLAFFVTGRYLVTRSSTLDTTCMATFLMFLASSQFSGDFYDSRGVFLFMPLVVVAFKGSDSKAETNAPPDPPASRALQ